MKSYIRDALTFWGNKHVNDSIDLILKNGTEGDKQLEIYRESGLDTLKQYLMNSVEYKYQ